MRRSMALGRSAGVTPKGLAALADPNPRLGIDRGFRRLGAAARDALRTVGVLERTGVLPALSPSGMLSFTRRAFAAGRTRTGRGPHMTVMLHAANKPEKIAVVDGARRISYGAFDRAINQLAHGLVGLGVRPGDPVALMLENGSDYLTVQLALSRVGATAVQIGCRLQAGEVGYILDNATPRVTFVASQHLEVMLAARSAVGGSGLLVLCGPRPGGALTGAGTHLDDLVAGQPSDHPPALAGAGKAGGAVIVYTSGTTGKPKGASRDFSSAGGYEAVLDFVGQIGMSHDDRHLVTSPLYHSAASAFAGMMFALGGTVVVEDHFDAEAALAVIARERITSAFLVPTMLVRLTSLPEAVRRRHDTSSLRWVVSTAAPLATDTARRFQEQFGPILWNFYGATETGMVTLAGPDDHVARAGTIGRALRGNQVRLLDADGDEVAVGEVGEVYVRNGMLITGYHRNPEATRAATRDGYFSVGDLGRVDAAGYYYLESRKHDMVISGGVNIYPREIEDYLHDHPDVVEAAVVGVPDAEWGESLVAFVVRRVGSRLDAAGVVAHCRAGLASYKRPRAVEFLDELPRTPTGKVLKRELQGRWPPSESRS